jgi:hypothetical protein
MNLPHVKKNMETMRDAGAEKAAAGIISHRTHCAVQVSPRGDEPGARLSMQTASVHSTRAAAKICSASRCLRGLLCAHAVFGRAFQSLRYHLRSQRDGFTIL